MTEIEIMTFYINIFIFVVFFLLFIVTVSIFV
jgi:hypothetical protein